MTAIQLALFRPVTPPPIDVVPALLIIDADSYVHNATHHRIANRLAACLKFDVSCCQEIRIAPGGHVAVDLIAQTAQGNRYTEVHHLGAT